ncbi:endonuclease MutS2 [Levilactobacillus yiduensis]|uniref:endonuclease MutS2 n=1 Tax=Levilactobacillus yiduensis TaxID=2953880 RepID=UPI000EF30689|nr:hypothetical protein [Levilactobacillus yiduensis]AYM03283.1 hypothetical protein D8911_09840 [Levilactobacillus brevis]
MDLKEITQLDQILATVATYTHSQRAADDLQAAPNQTDLSTVKRNLTLTAEAHRLLAHNVLFTYFDLDQLTALQTKLDQGLLLNAAQLGLISEFLTNLQRLKTTLHTHQTLAPQLDELLQPASQLGDLQGRLAHVIVHGKVADDATPKLADIRRQMAKQRKQVQAALTQFVQKHAHSVRSTRLITRNDRVTVQLKASEKHRFSGQVIDQSSTGSTVFFEPATVAKKSAVLAGLVADESAEVYQLLVTLTGDVLNSWDDLTKNQELLSHFDQIMARGQYGLETDSRLPELNTDQHVKIVAGRHPLLKDAVPLDIELAPQQGLMITGANSGGKTVVLKTIALFALMVQVGLELPAAAGTQMAVFSQFWIDIGDNQSITAQLSTFAAEMTTLVDMTDHIQANALVLLDEIGSGTDPEEGSALSIAIIEYLRQQHATIIATTHFSAIKEYAVDCPTFMTATMAFDPKTLQPTYRLLLHQVGASEAIWLAERLGLSQSIIAAARHRLADQTTSTE